ncbi:MBL fold metallo-hydrolase [Streptomyces nodosus]|uniref:MBL fold metallo-hydrolase n=1 Tax=Streptomyces nodosus TaxID=40318 RepID=UPI003F51A1C3
MTEVSTGRLAAPDAPLGAGLEEVADGVFAYVQRVGGWCVNNAGLLVEPDRVTVVDTVATEARAHALRSAVAQLTAAEPKLLVNTHFHGDHTFGNAIVGGPGATVVAHERARTEMAAAGLGLTGLFPTVEWGGIDVMLPNVTYTDRLTLHLGDRTAELLHLGPAHTTGDTVVWLPGERVLFAGDVLMRGCTPFTLMGSVAGSLAAIEQLRALGPRVVVGGHGPVSGPEVLDETAGYLRWVQRLADGGRAAGLSPLETAREAGFAEYGDWLDRERLLGNLHRAYAEAAGGPLGEPLDPVAVFREMVEFHGRPPECFA